MNTKEGRGRGELDACSLEGECRTSPPCVSSGTSALAQLNQRASSPPEVQFQLSFNPGGLPRRLLFSNVELGLFFLPFLPFSCSLLPTLPSSYPHDDSLVSLSEKPPSYSRRTTLRNTALGQQPARSECACCRHDAKAEAWQVSARRRVKENRPAEEADHMGDKGRGGLRRGEEGAGGGAELRRSRESVSGRVGELEGWGDGERGRAEGVYRKTESGC